MIGLPPSVSIYLYTSPVSMHNSFEGLASLVRNALGLNPLSGHLFLFLSKRRDAVKLLFWDRDGFALFYKRLERGCFHLPPVAVTQEGERVMTLASREMTLLLEGIDLTQAKRQKRFSLLKENTSLIK